MKAVGGIRMTIGHRANQIPKTRKNVRGGIARANPSPIIHMAMTETIGINVTSPQETDNCTLILDKQKFKASISSKNELDYPSY